MDSKKTENIRISYSQTTLSFVMTVTKSVVSRHEVFPTGILNPLKSKIKELLNSGKAIEYEIFTDEMHKVWKYMSENDTLADDAEVKFEIAQLVPPLTGISLKSSRDSKHVCVVSIENFDSVKSYKPEWISTYVRKKLMKAKIHKPFNEPQLHACLYRAQHGEKMGKVPLLVDTHTSVSEKDSAIRISASRVRKEISLVINKKEFFDTHNHDDVVRICRDNILKLGESLNQNLESNIDRLKEQLNKLSLGPAKFGIGLPVSILIAYGVTKASEEVSAVSESIGGETSIKDDLQSKENADVVENTKPTEPKLFIRVSDDRLSAKIVNFDMNIYKSSSYESTLEWLVERFNEFNIHEDAYRPFLKDLLKKMKMEQSLEGELVAQGEIGKPAEQPYLYEVYRHTKQDAAAAEDGKIDFRDLHQTDIVKEDTLICDVRYLIPAIPGKDVHGSDSKPPEPEEFKVILGEGIEERRKGQYWSNSFGVPQIKGNKINLLKAYVHIGDVNMKSGNVVFDGSVEIRGDIDVGATVEAVGDIRIIGNVEAGFVKSLKGSVHVVGGIITTMHGRVEAKQNVTATFVENSQIKAGQKLIVEKAILNSTIHVGDTVHLKESGGGMIAGGKINAGKKIVTPNLGFQNGHITIVNCGGDWQTEYSISINENRKEYLEEYLVKNRVELREITGKRKTDKESREEKTKIQNKIKKLRPILTKLKTRINTLKAGLTFYSSAEIFITDMLYSNCQVTISGNPVTTVMEYKEVVITSRKRKDDYIQGIPDYLEGKAARKEAEKNSA